MSNMTVFSFVVADLSEELSMRFSSDLYFKDMLTKICEDAGVRVHSKKTVDGICYKLKGLWCAMEQAHSLLTAAVDLHGMRSVHDTVDSQMLAPPTDSRKTWTRQKQSTACSGSKHDQSRLKPLRLLNDNSDSQISYSLSRRHSENTDSQSSQPHSDSTDSQPSQSLLMPHADNTVIKPEHKSSESDTHSCSIQKPPKEHVGTTVSLCKKNLLKRKSERTSHKKKQIAHIIPVSVTSPVCEERSDDGTAQNKKVYLTSIQSYMQHTGKSFIAKRKQTSSQKQNSTDQETSNNLCDPFAKKKALNLKTSSEVSENETPLQPEKAQKRGRSRKSVPRQIALVSNKYPFLSKYKDQSYSSLSKTVHRLSKDISPVSLGGSASHKRGKKGLPQKYEEDNHAQFSCSVCKFVTLSKSKLMGHIHKRHKGNPVRCDLCGKVFDNKTNMHRHRVSHTSPQHCCDVCGKMFKIQKAMLNHKKTHDEGYTKPAFPCKLCDKTFCSQYIVDCHVRSFHLGQRKSYLCSFCGKKFTTKHSLQEHANAHTGVKPHICEICGKGFSYDSALRDHKFTHGDVKQFLCDVCDKSFCQRSGLKMHMRIHEDVKQFQCQECGREFTQKQALQRHERVHKGVKPFTCRLCSRSFSDASIIRRHLTLVHKTHKDVKTWREDIVCAVEPDLEYHVSYLGDREPDHQPAIPQGNRSNIEPRPGFQSRAQTRKNTKKKNLPQKETGTIADPNPPVPGQSEAIHAISGGGELLPIPTSYSSHLLSVSAKIHHQDTSSGTSAHIDKNVLDTLDHDAAGIQLQSQDPDLTLASVTVPHSQSENPLITPQSTSQQKCTFSAVSCSTMEGEVSFLCTNKPVALTVQPAASQSLFLQTNTVGDHYPQQHPYSPHSSHAYSRESSCTMPLSTSATSSKTCSTFAINAQKPWPSLYYYTQLASQFGMNLSDYPHIASNTTGSTVTGTGLGPPSPGLEHPSPCCLRSQSVAPGCVNIDHSSLLSRLQSHVAASCDPFQEHDCKDTRDMFSEGHGLMFSSPGVVLSRTDLPLDGGGNVVNAHISTELAQPTSSVNQSGREKCLDSNLM